MSKALFWDFDGTLIYSVRIWRETLYKAVSNLSYHVNFDDVIYHLSGKNKGFSWDTPEISYTDNTGLKWWDKLFKHFDIFYQKYLITDNDREKINTFTKSQILNSGNYTLYEDALTVLHKCMDMGYKNYILSNNFPELPLVIKDLGLAELFVDYVVSAKIGYEKPRIEIFQYALELAGFPDVCYMIGDNPIADILGGKAAGMKTILVHNDNGFDADYRCDNLSDIPLMLII